jgi:hypothetical protein
VALTCGAENDTPSPTVPPAAPAATPAAVHPPGPITRLDPPDEGAVSVSGTNAVRYLTDAKWQIAGYNDNEVVFTIFVTNQDARIIRCTTQIHGSFFENGQKLPIDDRAVTTAFPDQQVQVGNWIGMDQASGASYSIKCRPV